jgi:hypothetical protein
MEVWISKCLRQSSLYFAAIVDTLHSSMVELEFGDTRFFVYPLWKCIWRLDIGNGCFAKVDEKADVSYRTSVRC